MLEKVDQMAGDVQVGVSAQAIAFADVIVFAVPGAAVGPIVEENREQLAGKTIIDASNNMQGENRHALDLLEVRCRQPASIVRLAPSDGRTSRTPNSMESKPICSTAETKMQKHGRAADHRYRFVSCVRG